MNAPTPFKPDCEGVFYGLPAETYHKAPGVSQSTLKDFDDAGSPAHWKASPRKKPTADMEFGTICHTAILEPEKLATAYHVQPTHYPVMKKDVPTGEMKPFRGGSTWCDEWTEKHSDRTIIDQHQADGIPKIVEAVTRIPNVRYALKHGQREVSYFKRDAETGLLLKCRPDIEVLDLDKDKILFDPKKIQSGAGCSRDFVDQVMNFGYHIQCASYMQITGAKGFYFVPFDDDEPYDACMWPLGAELLELGMKEYRRILNTFAECVKADGGKGRWPGYDQSAKPLVAPGYVKKRIVELNDIAHNAWLKGVEAHA